MRVAVMQPYFYPYPLYFHLIASVDRFVVFDCVQFPRRGRVHRAPLPGDRWLTLPLAKQPVNTTIRELRFAPDADQRWQARIAALPWLGAAQRAGLVPRGTDVTRYLIAQLRSVCAALGITTPVRRSSELGLPAELRGTERVIAAARAEGADHYVNLPGGRALYDPARFADAGLALSFLTPYEGARVSLLHALATEPQAVLRAELAALPPPERALP